MNFKIFSIAFYLLLSNLALASVTIQDSKLREDMKNKGVSLDAGSKVILNQYLRDNKAEDKSLYNVTFTCKHSLSQKKDQCTLTDINFRKEQAK